MRYYRKVIRITAEDSPNVQYAMKQIAAGQVPTGEVILEGVLPWDEYRMRRKMWHPARQRVSLDAQFPTDDTVLLFTEEMLSRATEAWRAASGRRRIARAVGCDPAEGGDSTAFAAVDEYGLIELMSTKTPNTNVIPGMLVGFAKKHGASPENWVIDRGNGLQHADRLRSMGYPVRTCGFGSKVQIELRYGMRLLKEKQAQREEMYAYKNRRAQMFGELSRLMQEGRARSMYHVALAGNCFAIPPADYGAQYAELRRQLSKFPLLWDKEGQLMLPPKGGNVKQKQSTVMKTLIELMGHSPDEADAVALAVFGMLHKSSRRTAGAVR